MATRQKKMTTMRKGLNTVKKQVKNLHNLALESTDTLVDGSLATGSKWQKISAKALKNGYVIADKQQDLFFDTLVSLKGQVSKGNRQVRELFDFGFKKEIATKKFPKKVSAKKASIKKAATSKVDDLKKITGIGPKMEKMLNAFGVKNFESLATVEIKKLGEFLKKAGPRFASLDPSAWIKEARTYLKK